MTTFLIVDDHAAFRRQARALLEAEGLEVIGEAGDGPTAIDAVRALRPDVVLLDIGLPGVDGFAVASRLAEEIEPPHVILISSREASTFGPRLSTSGGIGFIQKDDLSAAALEALLSRSS
ncbi:MAG TPA: response regulator transcription factor [Candidatus Limnocylindrales bacterium]|jgi:DNA-binding NarL/FixJ family response regulator